MRVAIKRILHQHGYPLGRRNL
ncbi:DUF3387 domain-containing protein [Paraburkholderia dokdonensis]